MRKKSWFDLMLSDIYHILLCRMPNIELCNVWSRWKLHIYKKCVIQLKKFCEFDVILVCQGKKCSTSKKKRSFFFELGKVGKQYWFSVHIFFCVVIAIRMNWKDLFIYFPFGWLNFEKRRWHKLLNWLKCCKMRAQEWDFYQIELIK